MRASRVPARERGVDRWPKEARGQGIATIVLGVDGTS
jgi:hypothetical protein